MCDKSSGASNVMDAFYAQEVVGFLGLPVIVRENHVSFSADEVSYDIRLVSDRRTRFEWARIERPKDPASELETLRKHMAALIMERGNIVRISGMSLKRSQEYDLVSRIVKDSDAIEYEIFAP